MAHDSGLSRRCLVVREAWKYSTCLKPPCARQQFVFCYGSKRGQMAEGDNQKFLGHHALQSVGEPLLCLSILP